MTVRLSGLKLTDNNCWNTNKTSLIMGFDYLPINYYHRAPVSGMYEWFLDRVRAQHMFKFAKAIRGWYDQSNGRQHTVDKLLTDYFCKPIEIEKLYVTYNLVNTKNEEKLYNVVTFQVPGDETEDYVKNAVAYMYKQELALHLVLKNSRTIYSREIKRKEINKVMPTCDFRSAYNTGATAKMLYYVLTGKIYG